MATKTTAGRVAISDLVQVEPLVYEVPASYREDMRVPARIYADDYILDMAAEDNSLEQLVNTTTLPGVVRYTLAMPDVHQGYGFPIGGVPPVAHEKPIEVFIDRDLLDYEDVWAAAGTPNAVFRIKSKDLPLITNGRILDVS